MNTIKLKEKKRNGRTGWLYTVINKIKQKITDLSISFQLKSINKYCVSKFLSG